MESSNQISNIDKGEIRRSRIMHTGIRSEIKSCVKIKKQPQNLFSIIVY